MISINSLEVTYGNERALSITSPISFDPGDRIGIIGSNGAGKTTLVKSILGLTRYKGNIHTTIPLDNISVHMQSNEYVPAIPIRYIIEAILNTNIKQNAKLMELISFFDFESCLNKKFNELSGGQKQRLTIIMVLIQDTPLVFFDEVTTGLDFETRQQLMKKINEWYRDKNTTICIVSHYYEELENLVNKILILEKGEIVAFGDKNELFQKYCGKAIITLENNEKNKQLLCDYSRILSPEHLLAFPCRDMDMELALLKLLIEHNVNFKRSNSDIEIMSINAKAEFFNGLKGGLHHE